MARTNYQSPNATASNSTPLTTASISSRIIKSKSETSAARSTRQRSRMQLLASASSSGKLQNMVEQAREFVAGASDNVAAGGKGKSRALGSGAEHYDSDVKMAEALQAEEDALGEAVPDLCPVTDKDTKPFPIMELPTEIRLEIYRACLTRPYNILLSKKEQPPAPEKEAEYDQNTAVLSDSHSDIEESDDGDGEITTQRRSARHSRNVSAGSATSMVTGLGSRRAGPAGGLRGLASRGARPVRLLATRSAPGAATNGGNETVLPPTVGLQSGPIFRSASPRTTTRRGNVNSRSNVTYSSEPKRLQSADPLLVNILRASREIYKEARSVLYSENIFHLDLNTAMATLACLHQRSRRQIKHIELEIPTYNEILERFQETVRLSLRYCTGLKKIVVHMPFTLPGADGSGTTGNTTVYANGFDILRWLPQQCAVILTGNTCTEIETVVNKHLHLAKTLDKLAYARRQLISNDTGGQSSNPSS